MPRPESPAGGTGADTGLAEVYGRTAAYYTETVTRFGATPRGADWSCQATQEMRFVQLLKLCDFTAPFSLNDLGCGYGALVGFLARRHPAAAVDYLGIDLADAMIRRARRRYRRLPGRRFVVGASPPRIADYSIASGVMNVRLDFGRDIWEGFVAATLRELSQTSRRGFAVNFLAACPDRLAPTGLYRTEPQRWMRFCRESLGCAVELVGGYGMQEFTLLVRTAPDASFATTEGRVPSCPP